ncbi:unnamed protein product [Brassicogethes aeneus]|uniref:Uncharacterized protein n=1 Tax=Brassicogethes aeneus TaxID=1431903 RepID=A0A9P0F9V8_BRAAE|nr:unnamed protein product [Brassicogethes aeneus]
MKVVSEILESNNLNVIDAFSIINSTKNTLQTIRSSPDEVNNLIEASKKFSASLHVNADEDLEGIIDGKLFQKGWTNKMKMKRSWIQTNLIVTNSFKF